MNYNFVKKGSGEKIILVHGWGGSLESMRNLQELLCKDFETYNLELPGHGKSETMPTVWKTKDFQEYIENFLKREKIQDFTYIGHSFGGHLGMRLSIFSKFFPKKLILINSAGLKPKNSIKKTIWKVLSTITKPLLNTILSPAKKFIRRVIYRHIIRETDYLNTSGIIKKTFVNVVNEHLKEDEISKIRSETLLVWGDRDSYTPFWMGNKLNKLIQKSTLKVIEGTHGIPFQQSNKVYSIILKWIKKI